MRGRSLALLAAVAWAVVATWLLMILIIDGSSYMSAQRAPGGRVDPSCGAASETEFATATWQWFPPGKVCTLEGRRIGAPSEARGWGAGMAVAGLFLVAIPAVGSRQPRESVRESQRIDGFDDI